MKKVTAQYVGRRTYEVIAEGADGKTVRGKFKEPLFKDPKKYATNLEKLVNDFATEEVEIQKKDLYNQIVVAAQKAEREYPNLMV